MRGLLITGTDTGVGKSVLTAALVSSMLAAGEPVIVHKPAVTGLDEPQGEGPWPPDHELLGTAGEMDPDEVAPLRYGPAVSPHLAARMAGESVAPERFIADARAKAARGTLIMEGVGGLLVPLCEQLSVRQLAVEMQLGVVIAARPGLGTINHTLLTIEAARSAGLSVHAVVLSMWPSQPDAMQLSNRDSIELLGDVPVSTLGTLDGPGRLRAEGDRLPWRRWLDDAGRA